MKGARGREGHEQVFFCPPRSYANLVGLIVLEKSGTNWSNTRDLYKIIEGDTQVTPSHISNIDQFRNCICGTPKVSK